MKLNYCSLKDNSLFIHNPKFCFSGFNFRTKKRLIRIEGV